MNLQKLVDEDRSGGVFRVHRSVFSSAEIAALEQENIFQRCWLYLGHDSEIPNAGDFRRRTVAGQPLFWVRGSDGRVRVFYNSCTHWGANVCRVDEGNAELFQCFYHAWTFNNQGDLVSVPDEAGYGEGFRKETMGLVSPPRVDNYRGLYFVSFNRDAEDLVSYLGTRRITSILFSISRRKAGAWFPAHKSTASGPIGKCFRSTVWITTMCGRCTRPFSSIPRAWEQAIRPVSPPTEFPGPARSRAIFAERSWCRRFSIGAPGPAHRTLASHSRRGFERGN